MATVRVTIELSGAWEIREVDLPEGTDTSDLSAIDQSTLDSGVLIDSGYDSASVTNVEENN